MIPNAPNQHSTGLNLAPHPHKWSSFLAMFGGSWHLLKKGCDPNPPKKNEDTKVGDTPNDGRLQKSYEIVVWTRPQVFCCTNPTIRAPDGVGRCGRHTAFFMQQPKALDVTVQLHFWRSGTDFEGETPSKNGRGGEVATSQANFRTR